MMKSLQLECESPLDNDAVRPHWRKIRLGEAFSLTKKPARLRYSDFERIPFVPMEAVPVGRMYFEQFTLKQPSEVSSGTYFEPGDVLVAKITPSFENGKQGIIEKLPTPFGVATTEVIPLKEAPGLSDKQFLFYYLLRQDVRTALAAKMEGSTGRQRLSAGTLASWEIELPPLPEQRAIARVLRTVQDAIQARRRELELERERKAALMQHLFTHGTRGEPTKQTEIGEMPESWQVVRLGDMASISTGTTPATDNPAYYSGTIPFVKTSEIANSRITEAATRITTDAVRDYGLKQYAPGTVVVAMYGQGKTRGQVAILDIAATITQNTAAIVPNPELNSEFLWQWLMSQYENLREAGHQGHISHLNLGYVKQYLVPLPSLAEQHQIADVLGVSGNKLVSLEGEMTLLQELFRALLEELMTGRLSTLPLIEAEDEAATNGSRK